MILALSAAAARAVDIAAPSDAARVAVPRQKPVRQALFARVPNYWPGGPDQIKFERWLPSGGPGDLLDRPPLFAKKSGAVIVRAAGMTDEDVAAALKSKTAYFVIFHDQTGAYEAAINRRSANRLPQFDGHSEITIPGLAGIEEEFRGRLQGTSSMNGPQKLAFLWRSGAGRGGSGAGSLDFSMAFSKDFYLFDRRIYDSRDFGNFLWGAALHQLDVGASDNVNLVMALLGAHVNDLLNACRQNPQMEECRGDPGRLHTKLDSPVDQEAIRRGFEWSRRKESGQLAARND